MTAEQLALISTDPQVLHGQAVLAGARVPVSVIRDCLAAGMGVEEIIAEYPVVTSAGLRPPMVPRWRGRNCRRCRLPGEIQAG